MDAIETAYAEIVSLRREVGRWRDQALDVHVRALAAERERDELRRALDRACHDWAQEHAARLDLEARLAAQPGAGEANAGEGGRDAGGGDVVALRPRSEP